MRSPFWATAALAAGVLLQPALLNAEQASTGGSAFGVSKDSVFWAAFLIMTFLLLILFAIAALCLLRSKSWSFGEALSEEAGNQPSPLPVGVKAVLVASSSRLIAFLGLLTILVIFLGFGYYILYAAFAGTLTFEEIKDFMYFLFGGATMFAPYLANQLQSAFSAFSKQ